MRGRGSRGRDDIIDAALGLVLGARRDQSRRDAFLRLHATLKPGRGSLAEFGGTPCGREDGHIPLQTSGGDAEAQDCGLGTVDAEGQARPREMDGD